MGQSTSKLQNSFQGSVDLISRKRRKSISEQDRIVIDGSSLACPVCFSAFQKPIKILLCGHSFCNVCLKKLINARVYSEAIYVKQVECPLCRALSTFGPDKEPTVNRSLGDILDSVEIITEEEQQKRTNLDPNFRFEVTRLKNAAAIAQSDVKAKEAECNKLRQENTVLVQFMFGCCVAFVVYKLYSTYFAV